MKPSQLKVNSPGWCGSVGWVLACKTKGGRFDFHSGHVPGLRARSPFGCVWEANDWCISRTLMFLSLSFSLLFPLSKNKWIKSLKKWTYQHFQKQVLNPESCLPSWSNPASRQSLICSLSLFTLHTVFTEMESYRLYMLSGFFNLVNIHRCLVWIFHLLLLLSFPLYEYTVIGLSICPLMDF